MGLNFHLFAIILIMTFGFSFGAVSWRNITIVDQFYHNPNMITEGLAYLDGILYESSGGLLDCTITSTNLSTHDKITTLNLCRANILMGADITALRGNIFQLIENNNITNVYAKTLDFLNQTSTSFSSSWGITTNGTSFIVSNGSNILTFTNLNTQSPITVTLDGVPYDTKGNFYNGINQLEYIENEIWAIIWHTFTVVTIDPTLGNITSFIDFSLLKPFAPNTTSHGSPFLSGIAYNPQTKRVIVTGAEWDNVFEVNVSSILTPSSSFISSTFASSSTFPSSTSTSTSNSTLPSNSTTIGNSTSTAPISPPPPDTQESTTKTASQAIVLLLAILAKVLALFTTYFKKF